MDGGEGVGGRGRRARDEEGQQHRQEEGEGESPRVDVEEEAAPMDDGRRRWRRRRRDGTDSEQPTDWCNLLLLSLVTGFGCIFVYAWVEAFREVGVASSSSCPILSALFDRRNEGVPVDLVLDVRRPLRLPLPLLLSLTAEAAGALLCSVPIERKKHTFIHIFSSRYIPAASSWGGIFRVFT